MCTSLILGSLKISLMIFNVIHALLGICILVYGCYLEIDYGTYVVTIVTLSVGAFIAIVGCFGICSAATKNWCCLTSYSILMGILFGVNLAILIVAFSSYDTLVGAVDSDNTDIHKFQDDLKRRKDVYIIIQCVVVLIEFVCIWFGLMYRKHDGEIAMSDGYENFATDQSNDFSLASSKGIGDDEDNKPLTDAQKRRQDMKEKYGIGSKK
mmetsp:Transcript_19117/g.30303  ORF Transcript_19117/g.30303 Transcript_19117/m.30303 type:complete len:210 (+) Transcript_19117:27-656(+)